MTNSPDARDFVGIWNGSEPSYELARFENLDLLVMLGRKPVRRGHSLVIPRAKIEHWHDLPPTLAAKAMILGQITSKYLFCMLTPNPSRVELHVMGYRVPHTHLKIIPSYTKSDNRAVFEFTEPRPNTNAEELHRAQCELVFPSELIEVAAEDIPAGDTRASFNLIKALAEQRTGSA
jgi:diadenosine tetraphosphate (Ap4A) HIT family hydrolase